MALLLGVGFLAGVLTAISPCVLPVLPILLAGGAAGGKRRPYAIVAGLVLSFATFTLATAWLIDRLGLPDDLLRNVALGLLFVVAATLLFPRLGELLERPLLPLTRRRPGGLGGGFLLGVSLGLVFVPCAGPVFAYVAVRAASESLNAKAVLLTVAYSLGAAVPMLLVALGGRELAGRFLAAWLRPALGVAIALAGLAIAFHVDTRAQTALGGYTNRLQDWIEGNDAVTRRLQSGDGGAALAATRAPGAALDDLGLAPDFRRISHWLNTPGGRPLSVAGLRGKVVLVDFWTYSCVNCLRTLPHLEAWDAAYRKDGLAIVGVHTPEFAFERDLSNVRGATKRLGVRYPVALDNDYGTWDAYSNQYWPAEYLIDRRGHVRHVHFGEGDYDGTERAIRSLLAVPAQAPPVADRTPTEPTTPESYLGYQRLDRYAGSPVVQDREASYRFPQRLRADELAYAGRWRVEGERIVAGRDARLRLRFHARNVFLVLGGRGEVRTSVDGRPTGAVRVEADRLYTLVSGPRPRSALLELRFSPGVEAYAFTFG